MTVWNIYLSDLPSNSLFPIKGKWKNPTTMYSRLHEGSICSLGSLATSADPWLISGLNIGHIVEAQGFLSPPPKLGPLQIASHGLLYSLELRPFCHINMFLLCIACAAVSQETVAETLWKCWRHIITRRKSQSPVRHLTSPWPNNRAKCVSIPSRSSSSFYIQPSPPSSRQEKLKEREGKKSEGCLSPLWGFSTVFSFFLCRYSWQLEVTPLPRKN